MNDTTTIDEQHEALFELCGNDPYACSLISEAWNFAIVYDDMIDGDKRASEADMHRAMRFALDAGSHPFMQKYPALGLVFTTCMVQWRAATEMERAGQNLEVAYVLRMSPYTFFTAVVLAASGGNHEKAREAVHLLHSINPADTLGAYCKEYAPQGEA